MIKGNCTIDQERKLPDKMLDMKERINQLLEKIDIQQYERARTELLKLRKSIEEDAFTVAVVGEFSRGKSTFVNALIRKNILPMDVLPETAVLQVVEYAPEIKVTLVRKDGTKETVPADKESLERFSVNGSESLRKEIAYLHIGCPACLLKNHIVLIDTPGVMDMEEQRADITYGILPQADMVIFLLDATSPLKKTEYEFITKQILPQGITSIVFVANKADNVDEEEEDSFAQIQKRLENAFLNREGKTGLSEIKLFPLSAKMALRGAEQQSNDLLESSGVITLERYLFQALQSTQRDETLFRRYCWKYEHIRKHLSNEIVLERNLKLASVEELEAKRSQLEKLVQEHESNAQQIDKYVQEQIKIIYRMVDKSLQFNCRRLSEEVKAAVMDYHGTEFQYFVEKQLARRIQQEIDAGLNKNARRIGILLKKIQDQLARGMMRQFNKALQTGYVYTSMENEKHYFIELEAEDISNTDVFAGAIAAVGGIGLGLIASSMLMPFVSFAALPFIRRSLISYRLAQAQQEVLPLLEESLADCYAQIQKDLHESIAQQGRKIADNFDRIYQMKLEEIKRQVEEERQEKADQCEDDLHEAEKCAGLLEFIGKLSY